MEERKPRVDRQRSAVENSGKRKAFQNPTIKDIYQNEDIGQFIEYVAILHDPASDKAHFVGDLQGKGKRDMEDEALEIQLFLENSFLDRTEPRERSTEEEQAKYFRFPDIKRTRSRDPSQSSDISQYNRRARYASVVYRHIDLARGRVAQEEVNLGFMQLEIDLAKKDKTPFLKTFKTYLGTKRASNGSFVGGVISQYQRKQFHFLDEVDALAGRVEDILNNGVPDGELQRDEVQIKSLIQQLDFLIQIASVYWNIRTNIVKAQQRRKKPSKEGGLSDWVQTASIYLKQDSPEEETIAQENIEAAQEVMIKIKGQVNKSFPEVLKRESSPVTPKEPKVEVTIPVVKKHEPKPKEDKKKSWLEPDPILDSVFGEDDEIQYNEVRNPKVPPPSFFKRHPVLKTFLLSALITFMILASLSVIACVLGILFPPSIPIMLAILTLKGTIDLSLAAIPSLLVLMPIGVVVGTLVVSAIASLIHETLHCLGICGTKTTSNGSYGKLRERDFVRQAIFQDDEEETSVEESPNCFRRIFCCASSPPNSRKILSESPFEDNGENQQWVSGNDL